jgi:HAD superfamily hydrolase (TIGR01509 family)
MVQDQYEHEVLLKKNAKEIVEKFYAEGLILGIATANSKACYLPCLVRNKIDQYFSHVYDVKEFIDGKNTPEFFLDVASKMNLKPQEILIFEDTLQALISAKNGHFHTCGVYESTCSCEDEELKKSISEFYTLDYHEFL